MTLIIAEAGVNHNGNMELACKLIDAAVYSGADIVKFQMFSAKKLTTKKLERAVYQKNNSDKNVTQYEMLQALELTENEFKALSQYCDKNRIEFLSTAFDLESLRFLVEEVGIKRIKIPSGEVGNLPYVLGCAQYKLPIILSTGMCNLSDIELALGAIAFGFLEPENSLPSIENFRKAYNNVKAQEILKENVTLLHCTSEYPAPIDEVNLRVIQSFSKIFGLRVGYSDHTNTMSAPIAAVVLGASVIEKHLTLDRTMEGPDHSASFSPNEFRELVQFLKETSLSLGDGVKRIAPSESKNIAVVGKRIVAKKPISVGEMFSEENLAVKRSLNGSSPGLFWDFLGKQATKVYDEDDPI